LSEFGGDSCSITTGTAMVGGYYGEQEAMQGEEAVPYIVEIT
jgi:hypothetical protein